MSASTLEAAKGYLARGLSVIPLKNGKPAIESWREFQKRRPTEEELLRWFQNGTQNDIGIVTGKISAIAVILLDSPAAARLAQDHGLPPAPAVKAGNGFQAYFSYKDGAPNFQRRDDLPGIDLRAEGAYVIAPPSVDEGGQVYRWMPDRSLDDLPLVPLPEVILIKDPPPERTSSPTEPKAKKEGWEDKKAFLAYLEQSRKETLQLLRDHPDGTADIMKDLAFHDNLIVETRKEIPAKEASSFPSEAIGGLAGEFADLYSTYLESPWSFFAFGFLTCLGNLISDRVTLDSGIAPQPRLFTVMVGESADDRKSESIKQTVNFFEDALTQGSFRVCHGVGSAEGLARILDGNAEGPKRLILLYDELKAFVSKAQIENATLLPAVNSFFEQNRFQSATKTRSIDLRDVYLSLLGASTLDTFGRMWTPAFLDIGFLNRLWLVKDRGERRFSIPKVIPQDQVRLLQVKLGRLLEKFSETHIKLALTEEAYKVFDVWYNDLDPSPFSKRLDTYGLRLMIIFAVNEGQAGITRDIAQRAVRLLQWQLEVRRECDPVDAETKSAKVEEMIRRALAQGPIERRELQRKIHYDRYGVTIWKIAVDNLLKSKEIHFDFKTQIYSSLLHQKKT